jgi:AcrR family transcriptional regulator
VDEHARTPTDAATAPAGEDIAIELAETWGGLGLRERKRLRAMRRIQTVALEQFEEHGFDKVTIEHIAEHCEVSPSTVYRYFGTKEMLVIWDEYDPVALQAIMAELDDHHPLEAVRRVIDTMMMTAFEQDEERIRRRMRLAFTYPSIEAASTLQAYEMARLIAQLLAERLGRDVNELDIQIFSHAFVGGFLGGLRHWYATDFRTPLREITDRALVALVHVLDDGSTPPRP